MTNPDAAQDPTLSFGDLHGRITAIEHMLSQVFRETPEGKRAISRPGLEVESEGNRILSKMPSPDEGDEMYWNAFRHGVRSAMRAIYEGP